MSEATLPTPCPGWVLIQQVEVPPKQKSLIIAPTSVEDRTAEARAAGKLPVVLLVKAVSSESTFSVGERVFFYSNHENTAPVVLDPNNMRIVGTTVIPDYFLVREDTIAGRMPWPSMSATDVSGQMSLGFNDPTESTDGPAN